MVTKREVLELIAVNARESRFTSFEDLIDEFGLSRGAACDHLKRLWENRLIQTRTRRPKGFEFQLLPQESVMTLDFQPTLRGKERLTWYRKKERRGYW